MSEPDGPLTASDDARTSPERVEAVFRREAGRLVSVLTRIFGPHNLELAEDVVQEAFVAALADWSQRGIPANPGGWLLTTARNRAIDAIRRERTRRQFAPDLAMTLDSEWTLGTTLDEAFEEDALRDDQLRMIFMCCHPTLSVENRITLILKTLCGLSVPAIGRALLAHESTINKRLYRTRQQIRELEFAVPAEGDRPAALQTVHTSLYLLFNEGYLSTGDTPIRRELCRDALAMAQLVASSPGLATSDTFALLALMRFNTARFDSRLDTEGDLVPLDQQERARWDGEEIRRAYTDLNLARQLDPVAVSRYHLEAAIAARHCSATTFADTNWSSICNLYDRLLELEPTPVVALNRAVAISYRDGAEAAIPLVDELRESAQLANSYAVAAVLANLYTRAGSEKPALEYLQHALAHARTEHERRLIERQVERARAGVR